MLVIQDLFALHFLFVPKETVEWLRHRSNNVEISSSNPSITLSMSASPPALVGKNKITWHP